MRAKNANPSAGPLDSSQSASWISKTPGVCGGDACIRNTRITVWGLVERRNLGASDVEMLDSIPSLTREDLEAAWEYDDQHHEEIEQAIRENEESLFAPGIGTGWRWRLAFTPPCRTARTSTTN